MTSLIGLYSVLKNQFVLTTKSIGAAELEGNESINGINEWTVDDGKMSLKTVFSQPDIRTHLWSLRLSVN